jgi:two-component system, LytTR family, sensor kinase
MPKIIESRFLAITLQIMIWVAFLLLPFSIGRAPAPEMYFFDDAHVVASFIFQNALLIAYFYFNFNVLIPNVFFKKGISAYLLLLIFIGLLWHFVVVPLINTLFISKEIEQYLIPARILPFIFMSVLSFSARLAVDKLNEEKHNEERAKEAYKSELSFLRSQISPHFLFNVMNNLVAMSRVKPQLVEPTLIKLSSLMRYMLYESDDTKVSLEREADYLTSYIDLQMMRFGNAINIIFNKNIERSDIPNTFGTEGSSFDIEPMLLIPFVENAFKHGVTMVRNPEIKIDFKTENNQLIFNVLNKFDPLNTETKDEASGIGLKNVARRLDLLYPNQHQLMINTEGGVFEVNLTIRMNGMKAE